MKKFKKINKYDEFSQTVIIDLIEIIIKINKS